MAKKHWFHPKLFGWGFMPVSIEGWLMTLVFIVIILASFYSHGIFELETTPMSLKETVGMIVDLIIIMAIFSLIAVKKTKGEVKWNWGFRRK